MKSLLKSALAVVLAQIAFIPSALSGEPPLPPAGTVVTVSSSTPTITEGDSSSPVFTIKRSGATVDPVMIFYRTSGTAAAGYDYQKLVGSAVIPAGAASVDVALTVVDDKILEQEETVVFTLLSPMRPLSSVGAATMINYEIGDPSSATITIKDNDLGQVSLPTVQVRASVEEASEQGPKAGQFTLTRIGDSQQVLTVEYEMVTDSILWPEDVFDGGLTDFPIYLLTAAENGVDYEKLSGTATIPVGKASVEIPVLPMDDQKAENREHVTLRLKTSANYNINQPDHDSVLLLDNDPATPPLSVRLASPQEGARFAAGSDVLLAAVASVEGRMIRSIEFFSDGQSLGVRENTAGDSMARLFTFNWKSIPLGDHTLVAKATDSAGNTAASEAVHISVFRESGATVSITASVPETAEADPDHPGIFKVTRAGSLKTPLNVRYRVDGTAENGVDYKKLSGIVTIPMGEASAPIQVIPYPDKALEKNETVIVTIEQLFFITVPAPEDDYLVGKPDSATITILETGAPGTPPKVSITKPKSGESFLQGQTVRVEIETTDPDGYVPRMELYDGDKLIDSETRHFFVKPPPGQVEHFTFDWKNAPAGKHSLTAKAIDDSGRSSASVPVEIVVGVNADVPVVTIATVDAEASEADPKNTAIFEVRRSGGSTATKLNVRYALSGSAQNAIDYQRLSGLATIPAGKTSAQIVVTPIPDKKAEGKEDVTLTLVQLRFFAPPGPEDNYTLGDPAKASAVLLDAPVNTAPKIVITSPKSGARIPTGSDLPVKVEASDSDGKIVEVSFYADDKLLGSVKESPFTFLWKNVPAGKHSLRAKALDNGGSSATSSAVEIEVPRPEAASFVTRLLPDTYTPGEPFKVVLEASPLALVKAYAIEDQPPKGWSVGGVSDGGVFDPQKGRVKFGPFLDSKPRQLAYELIPPAKASGKQKLSGTASANGVDSPIGGEDTLLPGSTRHPADNAPADNAITIKELTAYATAWRGGQTWPAGPNPIPQSYVTRAGEIWRRGEAYQFDSAAGPAPIWWVPKQPAQLQNAKTPNASESSNRPGKAMRFFTRSGAAGELLFDVTITVTPKPGVDAWTVEEHPPVDWTVSNISDDGDRDAASGVIRWGVFFDDQERTLKYTVAPPASAGHHRSAFEGTASFDGVDVPIHARSTPDAGLGHGNGKAEKIHGLGRHPHGEVEVSFSGEPGRHYKVQFSTDLVNWIDLDSASSDSGEIQVIDTQAGESAVRYYRTVRTEED